MENKDKEIKPVVETPVQKEIKLLKNYYEKDQAQKRFSALITGESGSGKTFLVKTMKKPIHIDSFDAGGTKGLKDEILKGNIVVDTFYEKENPYSPTAFAEWKKRTDNRIRTDYYSHFGTYVLDSATTFSEAIMNYVLSKNERAGGAPVWNKDYTPQKFFLINYIKKLMTIPCNFILTGHLRMIEEQVTPEIKHIMFRFLATGQAMVTIPLLFDEQYVMLREETSRGSEYKILIESQGRYLARSRLKGGKKLSDKQEANMAKLLKNFNF